jgi:PAS domain S-box-containing protein
MLRMLETIESKGQGKEMQFTSIHETILNSMSEAVYVVDRQMRIQYANPAAEKLTGYSLDESVGKYCHHIFCEQSDLCADKCPPKKAMLEEAPILHREAETRAKNGRVSQTQISISPFFDRDECVGAVIVMKDITELKKAEQKIQDQNRFLTNVIDALPHPFYVFSTDSYELKLANKAAYSGELPMHMTCHQLSHRRATPCGGADHPCPIDAVRKTGRPVMAEHVHRDADGRGRDMEVHCFPIFDSERNLVQMIEYCVDISERKQAAEEREKLIIDLQRAVNEVKTLSGLMPICSSCKKIRDDKGYWNNLEQYISEHSGAEFSHGLCPECAHEMYPDYFKK